MADAKKSSTVRSSGKYANRPYYAAGATLILAGVLAAYGHFVWAAAVGIIGAVVAMGLSSILGDADCPICGRLLTEVGRAQERCPGCEHYVVVKGSQLVEIDADTVATSSKPFAIPMPSGSFQAPALCCACGAPSTRSIPFAKKLPTKQGAVSLEMSRFRLDLPYCDRHDQGADIAPSNTGADSYLALNVSSYAFYRAFMGANGGRFF